MGSAVIASLAEYGGFVGGAMVDASGREKEGRGKKQVVERRETNGGCWLPVVDMVADGLMVMWVREAGFWLTLDLIGPPPPWTMKNKSIYRWWKRDTLSLVVLNFSLGSTRKHPNHWFKVAMMNCQFCEGKWLVGMATLGQRHRL